MRSRGGVNRSNPENHYSLKYWSTQILLIPFVLYAIAVSIQVEWLTDSAESNLTDATCATKLQSITYKLLDRSVLQAGK